MKVSELIEQLEELDGDLDVTLQFVEDDGRTVVFPEADIELLDDEADDDAVILRVSADE